MANKPSTSDSVVHYTDKDGRKHWASRTAPEVVKGLASGEFKEVVADAPKVPRPGPAANPRPAGNGS